MANPYRCTAQIGDVEIQAVSVDFDLFSRKDDLGLPKIGSASTNIELTIDLLDTDNATFQKVSRLFELANRVHQEKVVDMKLSYWLDENQEDAIMQLSFPGWVSRFNASQPMIAGPDAGKQGLVHMLVVGIEPALDETHYKRIVISN